MERVNKLRRELSADVLGKPHFFGREEVVGGEVFSSLLTGLCDAVNGGLKNFCPLRWVLVVCVHVFSADRLLSGTIYHACCWRSRLYLDFVHDSRYTGSGATDSSFGLNVPIVGNSALCLTQFSVNVPTSMAR